jgi:hypothetical protein
MAKSNKTIRITGAGIYGVPTKENPSGELPIGFEFDTEGDLPPGWVGRAVIVGEEPKPGSVFVGNDDDDSEVGKARRELIEKAEAEFVKRDQAHAEATRALVARAEKAEGQVQHLREQLDVANEKLKAFDRDGDGNPGGGAAQDKPGLTGKNKAELTEIAKAEGVEIEDGATNDDIRSAIELAREAAN